jgi:hypothetical protein
MGSDFDSRPSLLDERDRVLDEHVRIRAYLDHVEAVATDVAHQVCASATERLRLEVGRLVHELWETLENEDTRLVPLLDGVEGWGCEQARALRTQHEIQRSLMDSLLVDANAFDRASLSDEVLRFVHRIRSAMNTEERDLRALDDEPPSENQFTG